jgi:guanylate kinase
VEEDFPSGEKTLRILSIDAEKRNREICDYVINNRKENGARQIRDLIAL